MINDFENMITGKLYNSGQNELIEFRNKSHKFMNRFNQSSLNDSEKSQLLSKWLGKVGKNCHIEPNFRCDYGFNIEIGENFYANYDCIILDCAKVSIGNNVMFGPRVNLFTAGHPLDAEVRNSGLEYAHPIKINDNVWIGGNVTVLPGVTIGKNSVVGAGTVVTKDIPADSIVVGNPGKVIRSITKEEHQKWTNLKNEYMNKY